MPGWTSQVRSSACALEAVDPARLVGGVRGGGEQAGGDEDEDQAGEAEEAGEVDADAAAVEADADRDRGDQAEHGAGAGGGGVGRVLEGGEQEDRGLEALAQDREEGHPDQRHGRAGGQRVAASPSSALLIPRAWRRIQTIM